MLYHETFATAAAFALGGGFGTIISYAIYVGQISRLRETIGFRDATIEAKQEAIGQRDTKIAGYEYSLRNTKRAFRAAEVEIVAEADAVEETVLRLPAVLEGTVLEVRAAIVPTEEALDPEPRKIGFVLGECRAGAGSHGNKGDCTGCNHA